MSYMESEDFRMTIPEFRFWDKVKINPDTLPGLAEFYRDVDEIVITSVHKSGRYNNDWEHEWDEIEYWCDIKKWDIKEWEGLKEKDLIKVE